jgi:hypothetical protein
MTKRKGEVTARKNERVYPHIVELLLPSGGFRSNDVLAFHRGRSIEHRRAEAAMPTGNTMSASASPILRTPMPSAKALVERG